MRDPNPIILPWRDMTRETETISRRDFLKAAVSASVGLAASGCSHERTAEEPPDIVVIVLDALRAQSLKMYGNPRETAPFMERLAHTSAKFQCFASATWTRPSVTGLFTGLMPAQHNGYSVERGLSPDTTTFPKILGQHGYRTGYFPTNIVVGPSFGMHAHFEHTSYDALKDHDGELAIRNCEKWLMSLSGEEPAFAYVHFYPPHMPYDAAEKFLSSAREEVRRNPFRTDHLLPYHRNVGIAPSSYNIFGRIPLAESLVANSDNPLDYLLLYEANIRYADSLAEACVSMWKRTRQQRRTVFILTSDHGENFGEHGLFCSHGKILTNANLYVPLLVHDSRNSSGTEFLTPVSHLDLGSSILELAGVPDTLGLGEAVLSTTPPRADRVVVSGDAPSGAGVPEQAEPAWAVTQGRWRLLYNDASQFGTHSVVRVDAEPSIGARRSKRVILPVPSTALRRPIRLAPGVIIDELALHSRYAIAGQPYTFSGSIRVSGKSTSGSLMLRAFRSKDEVVDLGTFVCSSGLIEIEGEIPAISSATPSSEIHFEAMWVTGGGEPRRPTFELARFPAWRRLFSYRVFEPRLMPNGLEFIGVELDQDVASANASIRGRSIWHCASTLTNSPEITLTLEAESGAVVWQKRESPFSDLFASGDDFSSIGNVLHSGHGFNLPFWIDIPATASAGLYELVVRLSGHGVMDQFPITITDSQAETVRVLVGRHAELKSFTGMTQGTLESGPDISPEIIELARRNPEEGHFFYLLSQIAKEDGERQQWLDRCLARTPFHLRANQLRSGSQQTRLTPQYKCDYQFQKRLRLYGFGLYRTINRNLLKLNLFWEVLAPMTEPFGAQLWLTNEVPRFWFLGSSVRPTHEMKLGEAFVETVALQLSGDVLHLNAEQLIEKATLITTYWPANSAWKRIEASEGGHLHLAAWKIGDSDPTRMRVPLEKGHYRLTANALLREDSKNQTRLELSLLESGSSNKERVLENIILHPGRERIIDRQFEVSADGAELILRYVMADNAVSHHSSNAVLRHLQLEIRKNAHVSQDDVKLTLLVHPYWEYAYRGWADPRYLSTTDTNGAQTLSANLGTFKIADLEFSGTDLLAEKRNNRAMYQLYDLDGDPNETIDLVDEHPETFDLLRNKLFEFMTIADASSNTTADEAVDMDDETLRELRAIGYLP